jgi:hypothetical protein
MKSAVNQPSISWSRTQEPVVLLGLQLLEFTGADISHLFAYAFKNGAWEQIPFQVDEVSLFGEYTSEDGIFDFGDEVVFMAMDLGEMASMEDWINDTSSQYNIRYQLSVTNKLNTSEVCYVYIYQSDTLAANHIDYVDFYTDTKMIEAGTYNMGLVATAFQTHEILELNRNGVDVLDRNKFRIKRVCRAVGEPFEIV